ncbi:MAG: methyltransferase domain-containing protein [Bacteroidetes bacterium]|nr:MAG: methyltransferase domain-containing protein [Bacteroidota bacterium]
MKSSLRRIIPTGLLKRYRAYKKRQALKAYEGDRVFCPICRSKYDHFADFGLVVRHNARCLNCGSLERHRLLYSYLQNKKNIFNEGEKKRMLHFAPEEFFLKAFANNPSIEYVSGDLFPELYNLNGTYNVTKIDITNIPFSDESFDVVLCNHVLEHIPDDALAMLELYRVMRTGGWGVFQVPIDYSLVNTYEDFSITEPKAREKAFGQIDHVRLYGQDYKTRLAKAGFSVTEDDYVTQMSSAEQYRLGVMPHELIYYVEKQPTD